MIKKQTTIYVMLKKNMENNKIMIKMKKKNKEKKKPLKDTFLLRN